MKLSIKLSVIVNILFFNICCAQRMLTWSVQAKGGSSVQRPLNQASPTNPLSTFGAGVFMNVPLNNWFSFQPQLGWMQKGYRQKFNVFSGGQVIGSGEYKAIFDYVPLDVTFIIKFSPPKAVHPFVQIGSRNSLLINTKIIRITGSQTVPYTINFNDYRRFTTGGLIALGVEWNKFALSIEANQDFSNTLLPPPIPLFDDLVSKFRWYGINFSYRVNNF